MKVLVNSILGFLLDIITLTALVLVVILIDAIALALGTFAPAWIAVIFTGDWNMLPMIGFLQFAIMAMFFTAVSILADHSDEKRLQRLYPKKV